MLLMMDLGLLTANLVLFDEVLGWRFDDFSGLVFSCWFGFDEYSCSGGFGGG